MVLLTPVVLATAARVGVRPRPYVHACAHLADSASLLLWRRILHTHGAAPDLGHFTRLGLLTVPATLVASTVALWGALRLIGV
ncbi:hypothetical protein [Streptomyces sp. NBC_01618]|uniref:hypothetical protein n=1 Tax=Streptomyces sp. NBC_01618 TaxID=2975900 RepID=UPI00386928F1